MADNNEQNQESLRQATEANREVTKQSKQLADAFEDLLARNKTAIEQFNRLNRALDSGRKKFTDIGPELEDLREAIEKVTDADQKAFLAKQLEIKETRSRNALLTKLAVDGMAGVVSGIASAGLNISKSLINSYQSNAGAFQMAGDAAIAGIDATFATAKGLGQAATAAGAGLMFIPGYAQLAGAALLGLGSITSALVDKLSGVAKDVIQIGVRELEATSKAFAQVSAAGAVFTDGLTGFRNAATESMLTQDQFAKILADNSQTLSMFGGSVTQGAQRFSAISRAMDSNRRELIALGFSYEDMAQGIADVMAMEAMSGNQKRRTDAELAQSTVEYLTNLRQLAAITGEDARKASSRARDAAMQAAVQAKLSGMDAKARERFTAATAGLPEVFQRGIMQMFATGAIADTDLAAALGQMPGAMELITRASKYASDSTLNQGDVTKMIIEDIKNLSPQLKNQANAAGETVGAATLLTGQYAQLSKIIEAVQQLANRGLQIDEKSADAVDKAKRTTDSLTQSFTGAVESAQNLKMTIQDLMLPAITGFAGALNRAMGDIERGINKMLDSFGVSGGSPVSAQQRRDRQRRTGQPLPSPAGSGGSGASLPGAPEGVAGLKIKSAEAYGGGAAEDALYELARQVHERLGPNGYKYFSAFNDMRTSSVPGAHQDGRAFDLVLNNLEDYPAAVSLIKSLGGSKVKVLDESKSPANPGMRDKWAPHIHTELPMAAEGTPRTQGPTIAGEAGPEAIIPLSDGRNVPVRIDAGELVNKLNEMISVTKDLRDISEKTLWSLS
jgi:hypothetical protein